MSFSTFNSSDKLAIARFLGYGFSEGEMSTINRAAANVQNLGGEYVEAVKNLIQQIESVQSDIVTAAPFASRSFQSGGSSTAQHFRGERLHHPRVVGRLLVAQLSQMMNLPVKKMCFQLARVGVERSFWDSSIASIASLNDRTCGLPSRNKTLFSMLSLVIGKCRLWQAKRLSLQNLGLLPMSDMTAY